MRIILYEPLPDINRAPIIADLALGLTNRGHDVLVVAEQQLIHMPHGIESRHGVVDCRRTLRAFLCSHTRLNIYFLNMPHSFYSDVTEDNRQEKLAELREQRRHQYRQVIRQLVPEICYIWNGQAEYQADFLSIARESCSTRWMYMECGWLPQKGTIYFDDSGVNAHSRIASTTFEPLTSEQEYSLDKWVANYLRDRPISKSDGSTEVFVPLQVDSDTNITLHSDFHSMQEFVQFLESWLPRRYSAVFRPHPMGENESGLKTIRENFRFDVDSPIEALIDQSCLVVGLNSTVLVESLIRKKPTIALANGILGNCRPITEAFERHLPHTFESQKGRLYHMTHNAQNYQADLRNGYMFPVANHPHQRASLKLANSPKRCYFKLYKYVYQRVFPNKDKSKFAKGA